MQFKDSLNKKDIVTSYIARGISICSGLITLPIVLHILSEDEIAMNYLMATLMSLVVLFDMGFSSQFARNFAFIFGGAQEISKEGTPINKADFVNYEILYRLIRAARKFYGYMSIVILAILLTLGTWYIYNFTEGFTIIKNSLEIWICFSISIVFDFFYKYYTPLLMGRGMISQVNNIEIYSIIFRIILLIILLYIGLGLWGIVISNLSRVIIVRYLSFKGFYTEDIREKFAKFKNCICNDFDIIKILWFNAKKSMIVALTNYTCSQLGLFFTGIYLGKTDIAGYGLLLQLLNVVSALSMSVHQSTVPIYSILRTRNNLQKIKENFFFSIGILYWIFIFGAIGVILVGPFALHLIGSNAILPATYVSVIAFLYRFLQNQHVICSSYMCSQNRIVDFESSTFIGIANFIGLWAILQFTNLGLIGVVCVQFITSLTYPNWKWPYEVCKEFKIDYLQFVHNAFNSTNSKLYRALKIK